MISLQTIRTASRPVWTLLLVVAGVAHVVVPNAFIAYYPMYLSLPVLAIYASAAVEWLLAALLWTRMQRVAWFGVAALMVVYVPVHVYVVTDHSAIINPPVAIPLWLAWVRLPMQFVLVGWAWWMGKRVEQ